MFIFFVTSWRPHFLFGSKTGELCKNIQIMMIISVIIFVSPELTYSIKSKVLFVFWQLNILSETVYGITQTNPIEFSFLNNSHDTIFNNMFEFTLFHYYCIIFCLKIENKNKLYKFRCFLTKWNIKSISHTRNLNSIIYCIHYM